jgi:hypothetical protein
MFNLDLSGVWDELCKWLNPPVVEKEDASSFNGRTPASGAGYVGSNPAEAAKTLELKRFKIVFMPFDQSDATAEQFEYGLDEEDALKKFEQAHPMFRVKEVLEA